MQGGKGKLIIFIIILETIALFFLGFINFQKTRTYLELKFEIRSKEEAILNKENQIKELNRQLEEIKLARQELEKKIQDLITNQTMLETELNASKEANKVLLEEFNRRQKEIVKKFEGLAGENKKTYLSLFNRIEQLLNEKIALEKELEKLKNLTREETPAQQVDLDKIVVQKEKTLDTPVGSVLEVNNEYNFVMVDLGKENNVTAGMRFIVLRDKKKIGEIVLKEIYKGMSLAELDLTKTEARLRRGDKLFPAE